MYTLEEDSFTPPRARSVLLMVALNSSGTGMLRVITDYDDAVAMKFSRGYCAVETTFEEAEQPSGCAFPVHNHLRKSKA